MKLFGIKEELLNASFSVLGRGQGEKYGVQGQKYDHDQHGVPDDLGPSQFS